MNARSDTISVVLPHVLLLPHVLFVTRIAFRTLASWRERRRGGSDCRAHRERSHAFEAASPRESGGTSL